MSAIHRFGRISALLRRFSQSPYPSTAQSLSSLRLVERQRATEHWHPKSAAAEDFGGEFGMWDRKHGPKPTLNGHASALHVFHRTGVKAVQHLFVGAFDDLALDLEALRQFATIDT